jgi:hypothetical protein
VRNPAKSRCRDKTGKDNIINQEQFARLRYEIELLFSKDEIESIARETEWTQRKSKLTGHLFMVVFIFGLNIYGTPTLEQLVGLLEMFGDSLTITRQAVSDRINSYAVTFFEHMLSRAMSICIPSNFDINVLESFTRVIIIDSTAFQLPKELADVFHGCGGNASIAGMKIQFGYDIKSSHFFYIVQEGNVPDNSDKSDYFTFIQPNDLIITDLGYFKTSIHYRTVFEIHTAPSPLR